LGAPFDRKQLKKTIILNKKNDSKNNKIK
jgi:hypothetical protein